MDNTFMKEKPVLPLLLSMALPMVISMLVNSLYNIVDSLFVAKISDSAMTALSLVFPVQNFINAAGIGFGVGINAVIAFYSGAGDKERADRAATLGVLLAAIHGVILTVVSILIMPPFLEAFTNDQEVIQLGLQYSNVAFLFSVVINLGMAFEKIFQAVGSMKTSMVSLLCGCIVNIILDPMMIFGWGFPEMGIKGAALASGIGQSISLAIYIVVYFTAADKRETQQKAPLPRRQNDRQAVLNRCSRGAEPRSAVNTHLRAERNSGGVLRGVRPGSGNILQAANLPVSSHKRNNPGNAPAYRIQLRRRRV